MLQLLLLLCVAGTSELAGHPHLVSDAEFFAAIDLDRPGLEAVRDAAGRGAYPEAAAAWAAYFRERTQPTPHFDRDVWAGFIRERYPQLTAPIIEEAGRIAHGEITHGPFVLQVNGREINWTANPTLDTNYVSVVGSQWYMNYLGRAYLLSGDERYAEAFAWLFGSWYDHQESILREQGGLGFDPVYRAYYPGIRTRILVDNYYCLADSPALTPELHLKIMKQLLGSSAWLYKRNGQYQPGNMQIAAVTGLGITAMMFPEFNDAPVWLARARTRLAEHLRQDFFADGAHAELCTQYHKTCLRDLGFFSLTAEKNGLPGFFSNEDAPAFERAYDWLAHLIMPTGETPAIHSAVFSTDWSIHLTAAARYFERPDLYRLAERFWDKGEFPSQKAPRSQACFMISESFIPPSTGTAMTPSGSVHLEPSGFALFRDGWEETSRYCLFQYGWPKSGHAYPGALSFMVEMNAELVATHPGSPRSYREKSYKYCHSTRSHNIVTIDLANHALNNRFAPGGKLHTYADLPGAWYVSGSHDGYKTTFDATQKRSILLLDDGPMLVRDRISGGKGHTAHWNFHSPLAVSVDTKNTATLQGNRSYRICPARPQEITAVKQETHWMAVLPQDCQPDDCGKEIPVLRFEKPIGPAGVEFNMAIIEGNGEVTALKKNALRITTPAAAYVILYAGGDIIQADGISSDAECVCVRFTNDTADAAWLIKGTRLSVNDVSWLARDTLYTGKLNPKGKAEPVQ